MATKQQVPVLAARLVEFQEEFSSLPTEDAQWAIMNGKEAAALSAKAIANRVKEGAKSVKSLSILQLISGGEKIMIEAQGGKAYVFDAKKTFKSFIDGNFKNWGLNQFGPATAETLLDVSEMTSNGTFVQIFTGISSDFEKLVMTQAQIIRFCEKHSTWLRLEGYATFFLTKVNGKYFVVSVYVYSDGLGVDVSRLEYDHVWDGECRRRVVVPQLIPLAE